MNPSPQSVLRLSFTTGKAKDKSMSMIILNGTEKKIYSQLDKNLTYETIVNFPFQLKLIVFNKTDNDVIVDEHHNLIADTYILLDSIVVDNISCNQYYIKHKTPLTTSAGQILYDNYWGFNGEVVLDFPQKNSILWALETESFKP